MGIGVHLGVVACRGTLTTTSLGDYPSTACLHLHVLHHLGNLLVDPSLDKVPPLAPRGRFSFGFHFSPHLFAYLPLGVTRQHYTDGTLADA